MMSKPSNGEFLQSETKEHLLELICWILSVDYLSSEKVVQNACHIFIRCF